MARVSWENPGLPATIALPRRGTELTPAITTTSTPLPMRVLTLFEVARELVAKGVAMSAEKNALVRSWYPGGVPEDQLDALQARLTVRAGLRVVGSN